MISGFIQPEVVRPNACRNHTDTSHYYVHDCSNMVVTGKEHVVTQSHIMQWDEKGNMTMRNATEN